MGRSSVIGRRDYNSFFLICLNNWKINSSLPSRCSGKCKQVHAQTCAQMVTAAFLLTAPKRRRPQCPSAGARVQMVCLYDGRLPGTQRNERAIAMCSGVNGSQSHAAEVKEVKPKEVYSLQPHVQELEKTWVRL